MQRRKFIKGFIVTVVMAIMLTACSKNNAEVASQENQDVVKTEVSTENDGDSVTGSESNTTDNDIFLLFYHYDENGRIYLEDDNMLGTYSTQKEARDNYLPIAADKGETTRTSIALTSLEKEIEGIAIIDYEAQEALETENWTLLSEEDGIYSFDCQPQNDKLYLVAVRCAGEKDYVYCCFAADQHEEKVESKTDTVESEQKQTDGEDVLVVTVYRVDDSNFMLGADGKRVIEKDSLESIKANLDTIPMETFTNVEEARDNVKFIDAYKDGSKTNLQFGTITDGSKVTGAQFIICETGEELKPWASSKNDNPPITYYTVTPDNDSLIQLIVSLENGKQRIAFFQVSTNSKI